MGENMAFFGLASGMFFGAIASFVACFVYGLPLWMGLVTYSACGVFTTMAVTTALYMRGDSDDGSGSMSRFDEDKSDAEWLAALNGESKGQKVA